ncbi:MAG: hypothetical protein FVQ84_02505 [Planctomycetes bacterium]|nr:hypothetical protein [Planctomycetota bacterium]
MARSNFTLIAFTEHLGDNISDINAPSYDFKGNASSIKKFDINRTPIGEGYLILKAFDVNQVNHRIIINGTDLPGVDIGIKPVSKANLFVDTFDSIPEGILRKGENTVQIRLASGSKDNFVISMMIIHWKESGFSLYFDRFLRFS